MKFDLDVPVEDVRLAKAVCEEHHCTLEEAMAAFVHHIAVTDSLTMIEEWRNEELNIDEA